MDNGTSSFHLYLGHQMEKVSAHLADNFSNSTSNDNYETLFSRCPPVLEGECANAYSSDIPASTHYTPTQYVQARPGGPAGIYQPSPPAIPARYETVGMPYHEGLINNTHDEDSSDSESKSHTILRFIPVSTTSNVQGLEGSLHASVSSNKDLRDIGLADVDTNCIWREEGAREEYKEFHTMFDFVPSTFPIISRAPAVVPYQEQKTSPDQRNQFYKTGKDPATSPLRSSCQPDHGPDRPDGELNAPNGRYKCSICGLGYAQFQGLTRHFRETHKASLCMYCNDFKWGRPYRLREHIKKRHPGVDPSVALEEATRTRRRTMINREDFTAFHCQTHRMGLC